MELEYQKVLYQIFVKTFYYLIRITYKDKIQQLNTVNLNKARKLALLKNNEKRVEYFKNLDNKLSVILKDLNKDHQKLLLAMLYLGEGAKSGKTCIIFGNSDPLIIRLFLKFLRKVYEVDESKFRCTVQCRADQNIEELETYWSLITNIPRYKFYKAQIDKRSIGKPTLKKTYMGVLRINYFSSEIFWELNRLAKLLDTGL